MRDAKRLGLVLVVVAVTTCQGRIITPPPPPTCQGSTLQNDPTGRGTCTAPPAPPSCGTPPRTLVSPSSPLPPTATLEAEITATADPRPTSRIVYVATTEATVMPASATQSPTGKCITGKRIRVFCSNDLGATWEVLPGSDALPQGMWATDPHMAVDSNGTMFLTIMRLRSTPNCDTPPNFDVKDMQIWSAVAGGSLKPALPITSNVLGPGPLVPGTSNMADHPRIAASPAADHRVVFYTVDDPDFLATFQADSNGMLQEIAGGRVVFPGSQLFANLAFDAQGDLYVPFGQNGEIDVFRLHFNGGWQNVSVGSPPLLGPLLQFQHIDYHTTPPLESLPEATPAIAVTSLDSSSDPIVYVAFEVTFNGARRVQLSAANGTDLTKWLPSLAPPLPTGALTNFHPSLSADRNQNVLDLLTYDLEGAQGAAPAAMALKTVFYRFDASRLSLVLGPTVVNRAAPSVQDLPSRHGDVAGFPFPFPGEYVGLATKGLTAVAAFPDLSPAAGPANVDLGLVAVTNASTCSSTGAPLTLVEPDSLWECDCSCGGGEFASTPVVGCAPASATTVAAACPSVCRGSVCGEALACALSACSTSSTGRRLSANSCLASRGFRRGAPPASTADFRAHASSASQATFRIGGQPTTTTLGGDVFLNVSTSPPVTGAVAEIARWDARPADVFVGGTVGAQVRNMTLVHRGRLRGVFTDATHFRIDPGEGDFVLAAQTQTGEGDDVSTTPVNVLAGNPTPITGTLDLAAGTLALDGTAQDASGNVLEVRFRSTITSRPPDGDHDGIIDAVDVCPAATVGPDRTPPVFTFVPAALKVTKCNAVSLGTAKATDPCGVTITNDAPTTFPLGTTTVRWTARDGAGNTAVATQVVIASLGDDTSCCPAGTKIIKGTSGNDYIRGTTGSDCILGLGGDDQLFGDGGNDFISGGDGNDKLCGEAGNDRLYGGNGNDDIAGDPGDDIAEGGPGIDTMSGGAGNDFLSGGDGNDKLSGGDNDDVLEGENGDDQVVGDAGNDAIAGGANNDTLRGGSGNDVIFGQAGDDLLDGGFGENELHAGTGNDKCIDHNVSLTCPIGEGH